MRVVEAVLFDFGGVVVDGPFEAFEEYERDAGLRPGTLRRINSCNADTNAWARLERGEISDTEFAAHFEREAASLGVAYDARRVLDILRAMPSERHDARPAVLDIVHSCQRGGVRTALITNNIAPMASNAATAWVFEVFQPVIESCLTGTRKPDARIYQRALELIDVPPERVVMLDDLGINLKPARALGMRTIKVDDAQTAVAELAALIS